TKAKVNYSTTERECLAVVWAITKFRPYLYGRPFRVITDHHALCWLSNLHDPIGRLARWSLRLQQFDFTVHYKTGVKHLAPDALSRCPMSSLQRPSCSAVVSETISIRSREDMATLQYADPKLQPIISYLRDGITTSSPSMLRRWNNMYRFLNNLLYRSSDASSHFHRLVIPHSLRTTILEFAHDHPVSGHFGFAKTYERVRQKYFWCGLLRDVSHYVRTCVHCQRRKQSRSSNAGLMQPLDIPSAPFDMVGIDFFGPLPLSNTGNRYI